MSTPTQKALYDFNEVAPDGEPIRELQLALNNWQNRNFGMVTLEQELMGVVEEVGELAHAVLKHSQKIRKLQDESAFKEAAGDAIADAVVYLIQMCTSLRLDFRTLVLETASEVMKRDWTKNREDGQ